MSTSCKAVFACVARDHQYSVFYDERGREGGRELTLLMFVGCTSAEGIEKSQYLANVFYTTSSTEMSRYRLRDASLGRRGNSRGMVERYIDSKKPSRPILRPFLLSIPPAALSNLINILLIINTTTHLLTWQQSTHSKRPYKRSHQQLIRCRIQDTTQHSPHPPLPSHPPIHPVRHSSIDQ